MAAKTPEGPKADHGAEDAKKGYIPRPPSAQELDMISEEQALITDEWTGETPQEGEGPGSGSRANPVHPGSA